MSFLLLLAAGLQAPAMVGHLTTARQARAQAPAHFGGDGQPQTNQRTNQQTKADDAEALYKAGAAQAGAGQYKEAVESLRRAAELSPERAEVWNELGVSYDHLGRYKEAVESFGRAVRLRPGFAEAHFNLGNALNDSGRHEDAAEAYKQAIGLDPRHARAHNNLGEAYYNMGRYREAADSFKKAVLLKPDDAWARYNLGMVYVETGDNDAALEQHKALETLNPKLAREIYDLINKPVPTAVGTAPTPQPATTQGSSLPQMMHSGQFYVAPDGTSGGDGSMRKPWSLAKALSHPPGVLPGSTIWVRGGTYRGAFTSDLTGAPNSPVTLRAYPGERVTLDGAGTPAGGRVLIVNGDWSTFWGFEVTDTSVAGRPTHNTAAVSGVYVYAPHTRLVNLVVHDNTGQGIGFWEGAIDSEIYGCLIYYNGVSTLDHGIYMQNRVGTKRIVENVIFENYGFGVHAYGSTNAGLSGFHLEGNVNFNDRFLIGGSAPAERVTLLKNFFYGASLELGYGNENNRDALVKDNFLYAPQPLDIKWWHDLTVIGNKVIGSNPHGGANVFMFIPRGVSLSKYVFNLNTYVRSRVGTDRTLAVRDSNNAETTYTFAEWQQKGLDRNGAYLSDPNVNQTTRLTGVDLFVIPNRYETGRAHVVAYNWDRRASIDVNPAQVLRPGDRYEVRNAQDYFGAPVSSGTYGGGMLRVPTAGLTVAEPAGPRAAPRTTGPEFAAFVLIKL